MSQLDPQSSLSATIVRLSSKAGVVATVVIDSTLGSVIQSSGHYSLSRAVSAAKSSASVNTTRSGTETGLGQIATGSSELEELAAMVWKYVKSTESLIADLDSEDEIKLLRLRTRKHEFVIAPDPKYILVVVHEISGT